MINRILLLLISLNLPNISSAGAGQTSNKTCKKSEVEIHITSHIDKTKTENFKLCMSKSHYYKLKKSNGLDDDLVNAPGSTYNESVGSITNLSP